ncbi:MAG: transposase [bacterium]|nr:transposase [bacterium]
MPPMPRICPGSAYSDEMMIDVALSKYCDLIPIERYAAIAGRNGLINLPPQSLIQLTHYLADFVKPIYDRIREEVLLNRVIHADESVPRMQILEERSLQCCINDEGRPLGIGLRRLVSNNLKLHLSKAGVVSVKEKAEHRFCHVSSRKMSASEPLLKASKHGDDVKTRIFSLSWDKYRQNPFMDCTASGVEEA